jgi:hypothetical protein
MDNHAVSSPEPWEYRVIHLNVEPGPAQAASAPPREADGAAAEEQGGSRPVFSEAFLKKEFPRFYEARPEAAATPAPGQSGQALHPAQQLQNFLNAHGVQGWELIGLFPVGSLTMLFFRRRLGPSPAPGSSEPGASRPAAEPPTAFAPGPSGGSPAPPLAPGALLESLQARLTALEQTLRDRDDRATVSPAKPGRRSGESSSGRGGSAGRSPTRASRPGSVSIDGQDAASTPLPGDKGEVLKAGQLARLARETALSSSAAARALGLRSAASLANHGARYGYRPGLCKRGTRGLVAVYSGLGAPERGGKPRRLWIVVPEERLKM